MGVLIEAYCRSWRCWRAYRRPMVVVEERTFRLYYCKVCGRTSKIERKTLEETIEETAREMAGYIEKVCG